MYLNFQWLLSRLPAHSKVIVWAANTRVAKDMRGVPGEEGVVPFGSYIRRKFKSRAFALGFSAYSGSYAMTGQPVRPWSVAPDDSLEAQVFAGRQSSGRFEVWRVLLAKNQHSVQHTLECNFLNGLVLMIARWNGHEFPLFFCPIFLGNPKSERPLLPR